MCLGFASYDVAFFLPFPRNSKIVAIEKEPRSVLLKQTVSVPSLYNMRELTIRDGCVHCTRFTERNYMKLLRNVLLQRRRTPPGHIV